MKLKVEKPIAILCRELFYSLPRLATIGVAVYLGSIIFASVSASYGQTLSPWLPVLLAIFSVMVYFGKIAIDAYLHAQRTEIELTDKSINCVISGFTSRTFSIPLNQVSSVLVQQGFIDRFFNVSQIVVVQIASTALVYGFDYDQAVAFSRKFSSQQQKKGGKS